MEFYAIAFVCLTIGVVAYVTFRDLHALANSYRVTKTN